MKKIVVVLSMLVLAGSAFALNAVSSSEAKCVQKRTAFEEYVKGQGNNDAFIAQYILINMADPMAKLSNEAATPLAVCYDTYYVHGQKLVDFVRANATIFPGDISGKEAANMRTFAGRVDALSKDFEKMASQDNDYFIAQNILINMADDFATLSDEDAAPVAKVYITFKVKGEPMVNFIEKQARKAQHNEFDELEEFASRVRELAK